MRLSPIKPSNLCEEVLEQLKSAILDGKYEPGSKLPSVRDLSRELAVSQASVREAFSALKAMNLITVRQGYGTIVNQIDQAFLTDFIERMPLMSQTDILHILELRKLLESGTVKLAAERRTEEDLERIAATLHDMESDVQDAAIGEQADYRFHYEIARSSHNPLLVTLMDEISAKLHSSLRASRLQLFQMKGSAVKLLMEHKAIYHAIAARDKSTAERNMLQHLQNVITSLSLQFDKAKEKNI